VKILGLLFHNHFWLDVLNKRLLNKTGKSLIENFPNLAVFLSGGVHLGPFKKHLNQLIPGVDVLDSYIASEGYIAYQEDPSRNDLQLLTDHGIFYEFIDQADQSRHELSTVEVGKTYELVINNVCGLWGHPIGDLIEFTSVDPFRIILKGRKEQFINHVLLKRLLQGKSLTLLVNFHIISLTFRLLPLSMKKGPATIGI
jgi:hypothetical protein